MARGLRKLARVLSEELQDCGHDVTPADLLDVLASTGLTLRENEDEAVTAYRELASEAAANEAAA